MKNKHTPVKGFIAVAFLICMSILDSPALAGTNRMCNGSAELCSRRFSNTTFAGTHNAMSNRAEEWSLPNQQVGIEAQLESGIRAINLDLYVHDGEPYACHSYCSQGKRKLLDILSAMKKFLDSHPNEVLALYLEDATKGAVFLEPAFARSGILKYAHEQPEGAAWPTLGEMIDSGRRLVIIGNAGGRPWYHQTSEYLWSSPWDFRRTKDFKCGAAQRQSLYMMQHFILNPYPMEIYAKKANAKRMVYNRAIQCWRETGQRPNIILVDFSTVGGVVEAVAELNKLSALPYPPGVKPGRHSGAPK